MHLFDRLLAVLFPLRGTERLVREAGVDGLRTRLSPTSFSLSGVNAVGLLPYRDPVVRAFILEAKFRNNKEAQQALGTLLAEHLRGQDAVLIPIPLGAKRFTERGYNQVEAICRTVPGSLVAGDTLIRIRETAPQTNLSGAARRENMHGAFRAKDGIDPSHTYIVVDDVVTTGATLAAATKALPVSSVSALALAY